MKDTPETDKNTWSDSSDGVLYNVVTADFARKLERERDEARHEIEGWSNKWECAVTMGAIAEFERDEALKSANKMSESNEVLQAEVRDLRKAKEVTIPNDNETHLKLVLDEVSKLAKVLKSERDEARALLIRIYNDINVLHTGDAIRELTSKFRDENFN